ncbi:hypothetical protein ACQ86D_38510 [Streptomyces galilaeus]
MDLLRPADVSRSPGDGLLRRRQRGLVGTELSGGLLDRTVGGGDRGDRGLHAGVVGDIGRRVVGTRGAGRGGSGDGAQLPALRHLFGGGALRAYGMLGLRQRGQRRLEVAVPLGLVPHMPLNRRRQGGDGLPGVRQLPLQPLDRVPGLALGPDGCGGRVRRPPLERSIASVTARSVS